MGQAELDSNQVDIILLFFQSDLSRLKSKFFKCVLDLNKFITHLIIIFFVFYVT